VVQRLLQFANMFSQFWQQVSAKAEAGIGFARTPTVKTNAKRMNMRSKGLMYSDMIIPSFIALAMNLEKSNQQPGAVQNPALIFRLLEQVSVPKWTATRT
jgi:hypothetical protein